MSEGCLRQFDHVQRSEINAQMRKSELIKVEGTKKCRGKPKRKLVELVKKDMSNKEVTKSTTLDRILFLIN